MVLLGDQALCGALQHRSNILGAMGTGNDLFQPGGGICAEAAPEQRWYPAGGGI